MAYAYLKLPWCFSHNCHALYKKNCHAFLKEICHECNEIQNIDQKLPWQNAYSKCVKSNTKMIKKLPWKNDSQIAVAHGIILPWHVKIFDRICHVL